MDLTADRILTHRKHREEERPVGAGVAKTKADIAALVSERVAQRLIDADEEELDGILFSKGGQGMINTGLKAQKLIIDRESKDKRHTQAEALVALMAALRGEGHGPVALLDDPNVIEGQAVEVD